MTFFRHFILLSWILASAVFANPDPSHLTIQPNGNMILEPYGLNDTLLGDADSQDTINLDWALNSLPVGGVLHLNVGTFHVNRMIVIDNFQGIWEGEGFENTHIVARGPFECTDYVFPALNPYQRDTLFPSGIPHVFWFRSGLDDADDWVEYHTDLEIKHLHFLMEGKGPLSYYYNMTMRSVWSFITLTNRNPVIQPHYVVFRLPPIPIDSIVPYIRLDVNDIKMEAKPVDDADIKSNMAIGILKYGGAQWQMDVYPSGVNGTFQIETVPTFSKTDIINSEFDGLHLNGIIDYATYSEQVPESESYLRVPYIFQYIPVLTRKWPVYNPFTGSASVLFNNNRFNNVAFSFTDNFVRDANGYGSAIAVYNPSGVDVQISSNVITDAKETSISMFTGRPFSYLNQTKSTVLIKDNVIYSTRPHYEILRTSDFDAIMGEDVMDLLVLDNTFISIDHVQTGIGVTNGRNDRFEGNSFYGSFSTGILVEGYRVHIITPDPRYSPGAVYDCDFRDNHFNDTLFSYVFTAGSFNNEIRGDTNQYMSLQGHNNVYFP